MEALGEYKPLGGTRPQGGTLLTDGFRDWGFCGVSVSVGSTSRISDEKQRGEIMRAGEKPRGEHQHGGGVEGALVQQ